MITRHDLRDGSVCEVDDDGRMAMVCRIVDGKCVWGQVFSHSYPDVHAEQVASVVATMSVTPDAFNRRHLWDANGRAVRG